MCFSTTTRISVNVSSGIALQRGISGALLISSIISVGSSSPDNPQIDYNGKQYKTREYHKGCKVTAFFNKRKGLFAIQAQGLEKALQSVAEMQEERGHGQDIDK